MRTLVRFASILVLALLARPLTTAAQTAQGTAFTYQGQLLQNNAPVTGSTDMTFTLWDAATGGNPIGAALPFTAGNGNPVSVQNGIFTVDQRDQPGRHGELPERRRHDHRRDRGNGLERWRQ